MELLIESLGEFCSEFQTIFTFFEFICLHNCATDMFLVGTALVVFGVGLFAMFVGSEKMTEKNQRWVSGSNLFGLFYMKVQKQIWLDEHDSP